MVSSRITSSEKLASSAITTVEINTTKPATHNDNWVVKDVRIFWSGVMLELFTIKY
jgi:hypothetical protein